MSPAAALRLGAAGLLIASSAFAQDATLAERLEDPEVSALRASYDYGKYQEVLDRARSRIDSGGLGEDELAELHKLAGLSAYQLGQAKEAERHFGALLRLSPDYSLDPFAHPPKVIALFEGVRQELAPTLELLRQEQRLRQERLRREAEARERLARAEEEQRRRLEELSRTVQVEKVEQRSFLLNLLPFGAGQFQQGRAGLGVALAATQGVLAATSMVSLLARASLYETRTFTLDDRLGGPVVVERTGIPASRLDQAVTWRIAQLASAGAFYGMYAFGVIDAVVHHEPEVVTRTTVTLPKEPPPAEPPPSRDLAPTPTPGPAPERLPAVPKLRTHLLPTPGGLGAALTLTF
jgi:tetratricopeptide (TPR) repeat protein